MTKIETKITLSDLKDGKILNADKHGIIVEKDGLRFAIRPSIKYIPDFETGEPEAFLYIWHKW